MADPDEAMRTRHSAQSPRHSSPTRPYLTIMPPSPSSYLFQSTDFASPHIKSPTAHTSLSGLQLTVMQSPALKSNEAHVSSEGYGRAGAVSPCFSTISDTRTFYSAVEDATEFDNDADDEDTAAEMETDTPRLIASKALGAPVEIDMSLDLHTSQVVSSSNSDLHIRRDRRYASDTERSSRPYSSSASDKDSRLEHIRPRQESRRESMPTFRPPMSSRRSSIQRGQRPSSRTGRESLSGRSYRGGISESRRQDLIELHRESCQLIAALERGESFFLDDHHSSDDQSHSLHHSLRPSSSHTTRETESNNRPHDRQPLHRLKLSDRSKTLPTEDFTVYRDSWSAKRTTSGSHHATKRKAKSTRNSMSPSQSPHLHPSLSITTTNPRRDSTATTLAPLSPPLPPLISDTGDISPTSSSDLEHASDVRPTTAQTNTNHIIHPATSIDWTSPQTRRREYAAIDKSTRGIRGLWRKVAPKWCARNLAGGRTVFWEGGDGEDESDGGSVRRFRVDVDEDGEIYENDNENAIEQESKARPGLIRRFTTGTGRK